MKQLLLAHAVQPMDVVEMIKLCRQLASTTVSLATRDSRTLSFEKQLDEPKQQVAKIRIRMKKRIKYFTEENAQDNDDFMSSIHHKDMYSLLFSVISPNEPFLPLYSAFFIEAI